MAQQLSDNVVIGDLRDGPYKSLDIEEAEHHESKVVLKKAEKEVVRRVSVILDTPMSDQKKCYQHVCFTGTHICDASDLLLSRRPE